jgi:hypothetical protein
VVCIDYDLLSWWRWSCWCRPGWCPGRSAAACRRTLVGFVSGGRFGQSPESAVGRRTPDTIGEAP